MTTNFFSSLVFGTQWFLSHVALHLLIVIFSSLHLPIVLFSSLQYLIIYIPSAWSNVCKVGATVLLKRTVTNQLAVRRASASRTAVLLLRTAAWHPALLPSGSIARDFKNL